VNIGPHLDETQRRVLAHVSGPMLVLGGPGTGKTTTLVELVSQKIGDGLDPSRVLLLTPTRRAILITFATPTWSISHTAGMLYERWSAWRSDCGPWYLRS